MGAALSKIKKLTQRKKKSIRALVKLLREIEEHIKRQEERLQNLERTKAQVTRPLYNPSPRSAGVEMSCGRWKPKQGGIYDMDRLRLERRIGNLKKQQRTVRRRIKNSLAKLDDIRRQKRAILRRKARALLDNKRGDRGPFVR
ncbi:uncharacterized protein LOC116601978 [Nematostella vectensis]|uniref:uncharacterized protein LOC116601978 n=1 Tax=Nematostella vectensis TaxID=45351 RepID=UPI0020777B2B|nr:uncharacterized protein LOC116601978 [Nematostella vectensis]